jgi:heme exporter protein D
MDVQMILTTTIIAVLLVAYVHQRRKYLSVLRAYRMRELIG